MCVNCWEDRYDDRIDSPAVRAAADAIREVYYHHCVGGAFHIVLDDWNLEREHVEWCAKQIDDPVRIADYAEYNDDMAELLVAERACYVAIKDLTEDELASAIALSRGMWEPDIHQPSDRSGR